MFFTVVKFYFGHLPFAKCIKFSSKGWPRSLNEGDFIYSLLLTAISGLCLTRRLIRGGRLIDSVRLYLKQWSLKQSFLRCCNKSRYFNLILKLHPLFALISFIRIFFSNSLFTIIPRARIGYDVVESVRYTELAIIISYPNKLQWNNCVIKNVPKIKKSKLK